MQSRRFDQYELIERLGRPPAGEVYKARERSTSRQVLVRLLPAEIAAALRDQGHEGDEARRIVRLSHPNVLTVYKFSLGNGHPFVVSEVFDGYTLRERLVEGPLPLEEVLTIATSVAEGLRYAHQQGVVHGHLNPEHILVAPNGGVKVANFGFHRLKNGVAQELLGQEAQRYEAPEQWRGELPSPAGDIFSFGLILWEMLVGEPPQRLTDGRVQLDVSPKSPKSPSGHERVHPGLERLIRKCVAVAPADRYASFAEVQRDLTAANALYVEVSKKYAWRSPNPFWRGALWRRHLFATVVTLIALAGLLTAAALVILR